MHKVVVRSEQSARLFVLLKWMQSEPPPTFEAIRPAGIDEPPPLEAVPPPAALPSISEAARPPTSPATRTAHYSSYSPKRPPSRLPRKHPPPLPPHPLPPPPRRTTHPSTSSQHLPVPRPSPSAAASAPAAAAAAAIVATLAPRALEQIAAATKLQAAARWRARALVLRRGSPVGIARLKYFLSVGAWERARALAVSDGEAKLVRRLRRR